MRLLRFHGADRLASTTETGAIRFLDHLQQRGEIAASSHLQAVNALLFLFRHVLQGEAAQLEARRRQLRRPQRFAAQRSHVGCLHESELRAVQIISNAQRPGQ